MLEFAALVFLFYIWHISGVAIGLHRYLAHKSFKCVKPLEYFWVFGAYLAFHGSPVWWATIHRAHHRHVDTPLDPHGPGNGIWKAYTFYTPFAYAAHIDPVVQSSDLLKDPVYKALECGGNWKVGYALNLVICVAFRVVLYLVFGWQVALASVVAGIMALNVPLILNIVCHIPKLGVRNYAVEDDSVNVWWMSLICLGEGWHNNHHAFPGSAKAGIRKHEIDPSWIILCCLRRIGLVSDLKATSGIRAISITPAEKPLAVINTIA